MDVGLRCLLRWLLLLSVMAGQLDCGTSKFIALPVIFFFCFSVLLPLHTGSYIKARGECWQGSKILLQCKFICFALLPALPIK